jgi:hypothetical protein
MEGFGPYPNSLLTPLGNPCHLALILYYKVDMKSKSYTTREMVKKAYKIMT